MNKITHINNKAVAALVLLRGLEGSDADILGVYADLQVRYGLNARALSPARIGSIRAAMVSDHFAYLMRIIQDEKKAG